MNRDATFRSKPRAVSEPGIGAQDTNGLFEIIQTEKTMNPSWQDFLGASGARIENGLVANFGDLTAELVSARDATVISPLLHLGMIECSGEDAKSFLHNQLTSDVNHLASGTAQHSSWCTAKGRMQASLFLYRNEQDFRALLSADLLAATQKRLQMYILRSKVKITDLGSEYEVIGLSGPEAEAALQDAGLTIPAKALNIASVSHGTTIRLSESRFIVVVSGKSAPDVWNRLSQNARPAGTPIWQWLDVQAGIPLITMATKEAFVPQMADFDKIGGVSFHKGCYPGQEVVARTQYLGKVKRHLYRIRTTGAISAGTAIYTLVNPEHPCGMIANAAPAPEGGYLALAVVQEGFVGSAGIQLKVSSDPGMTVSAVELVHP